LKLSKLRSNRSSAAAGTLALAYGEDIARSMITFADTLRTMKTVREWRERGSLDEAKAQLMLSACEQGLTGLVKKQIDEAGGK
jgi:hypothetical protein